MNPNDEIALARWRLVLGKFADENLGSCLGHGSNYGKMDRLLDFLYNREYRGRGVRDESDSRHGGHGDSVLAIPDWLRGIRDLFPRETSEVLQKHALDKYGMTELVTDPEILRGLEPNYELLKAVLAFRGMMNDEVLEMAREIVRKVVEELRQKLATDVRQVLWGRLNRLKRSRLKVFKNLDWRRTIRSNLKNYDPGRKTLVLESLHFFSRVDRHMPWNIIMAVDCSGSMADSVIHSAVMAGVFKGLPSLAVRLVAFDTNLVDLSDAAADPTEVLMSVQLGGGTDIHQALAYCETLVTAPHRTILIFVTDFYEGGSVPGMLATIKRLRESGVRVLGLAALDQEAQAVYDKETAARCVEAGAEVAALTPRRLAEWIGGVLS